MLDHVREAAGVGAALPVVGKQRLVGHDVGRVGAHLHPEGDRLGGLCGHGQVRPLDTVARLVVDAAVACRPLHVLRVRGHDVAQTGRGRLDAAVVAQREAVLDLVAGRNLAAGRARARLLHVEDGGHSMRLVAGQLDAVGLLGRVGARRARRAGVVRKDVVEGRVLDEGLAFGVHRDGVGHRLRAVGRNVGDDPLNEFLVHVVVAAVGRVFVTRTGGHVVADAGEGHGVAPGVFRRVGVGDGAAALHEAARRRVGGRIDRQRVARLVLRRVLHRMHDRVRHVVGIGVALVPAVLEDHVVAHGAHGVVVHPHLKAHARRAAQRV